MDTLEFVESVKQEIAADVRALKLAELIRRSYEQHIGRELRERDWEAVDRKRERNAQWSEDHYNDPRRA